MSAKKTAAQIIDSLRGGLILSCQAEGDSPFNRPEYLVLFARSGQMGGARGIRACGIENIKAMRKATTLPIIGITKNRYPDGSVLITGDASDVESLVAAGADVIALDATDRTRPSGLRGDAFLRRAKALCDLPLMADVSTLQEGIQAADAGADIVASTLAGYRSTTEQVPTDEPDWRLLEGLIANVPIPVIMEGRVWTPQQARRALEMGALAVVVGTAITRPIDITKRFVDEMQNANC